MVNLKKISGLRNVLREMNEVGLSKNQRRELIKTSYNCWSRLLGIDEMLRSEVTRTWISKRRGDEAYNSIINEMEEYSKSLIKSIINQGY